MLSWFCVSLFNSRWRKRQSFKQPQEAAFHLDAHRLFRWVTDSDISAHQIAYICTNVLHSPITQEGHTHGYNIFWFAGNDLNMARERARVAMDEASSPVTPKVRLSCHVTSLSAHIYNPTSTATYADELDSSSISRSFCLCSQVWRKAWQCSKSPPKCFTAPTAGSTLIPPTAIRVAQSSRPLRRTC